MNAEDAEALFSAAYDADLPPEERVAFERALQEDPALAERYREFCSTIQTLKLADVSVPAPDLLAGVQRRLRVKSGGRFYKDRFAERAGSAGRQQLFIAIWASALILVSLWAVYMFFSDVQLLR
jgi:anti-sigma factor RsiW